MPEGIKSVTTPSVHGLPVLNPDGTNIGGASGSATAAYNLSDYAIGATAYLGYLDTSGNWYITSINTSTGEKRYVKGDSGYTTAWTGRSGLTYGYYDDTF